MQGACTDSTCKKRGPQQVKAGVSGYGWGGVLRACGQGCCSSWELTLQQLEKRLQGRMQDVEADSTYEFVVVALQGMCSCAVFDNHHDDSKHWEAVQDPNTHRRCCLDKLFTERMFVCLYVLQELAVCLEEGGSNRRAVWRPKPLQRATKQAGEHWSAHTGQPC